MTDHRGQTTDPSEEEQVLTESNQQGQQQAFAQVREQWGGVNQNIVAACEGNAQAAAQLARFFDLMEQKDEWGALIGVLRRIVAGERDPLVLLRGLDDTDTLIAGDALRALGVDIPTPNPSPSKTGEGEHDDDGKMISLEEFLQQVVRACKSDAPPGLTEQMQTATRGMATQPGLQPELRELGRVLNQIVSGERNPDLSALHPQLAERVEQILAELSW